MQNNTKHVSYKPWKTEEDWWNLNKLTLEPQN